MKVSAIALPIEKLAALGLTSQNTVHYQLPPDELIRDTLRLGEGVLSNTGALAVRTGQFTGRSPRDKFIVSDELTISTVNWNDFNLPIDSAYFETIRTQILAYLNQRPEVWVRDGYASADPRYRINIRVVNEKPWLNLFAHNMFLRPAERELEDFKPEWHILSAPGLRLDPKACGVRQPNAAVISFKHKMILIAGTGYTGEMKKGVFTVLNYLLPLQKNVLSMHCSANMGESGDTALFFGLSGTGKTTLSADPARRLIGDDEHGWTADSIFNFEGGCYAKTIDLNEEKEPKIFNAIRHGALVENMKFIAGSDRIDFSDKSITENTRVSYPIDYISNAKRPSTGNVPGNIFFLTCDATGVLPPISRLNTAQAMYQFISGYTARVAGTEAGVTEPVSTFSACFGAPFLPLHPGKYAAMLGERLRKHKVKVWLVNTGWTGGSYGTGTRIKLAYTRAMIRAALDGKLDKLMYDKHPIFGMEIPESCPGVPAGLLYPRDSWQDKDAYDRQALGLAEKFILNFSKYADGVSPEVLAAAPVVGQ